MTKEDWIILRLLKAASRTPPNADYVRATTYLLNKYGTAELNGYIDQLNAEGKK